MPAEPDIGEIIANAIASTTYQRRPPDPQPQMVVPFYQVPPLELASVPAAHAPAPVASAQEVRRASDGRRISDVPVGGSGSKRQGKEHSMPVVIGGTSAGVAGLQSGEVHQSFQRPTPASSAVKRKAQDSPPTTHMGHPRSKIPRNGTDPVVHPPRSISQSEETAQRPIGGVQNRPLPLPTGDGVKANGPRMFQTSGHVNTRQQPSASPASSTSNARTPVSGNSRNSSWADASPMLIDIRPDSIRQPPQPSRPISTPSLPEVIIIEDDYDDDDLPLQPSIAPKSVNGDYLPPRINTNMSLLPGSRKDIGSSDVSAVSSPLSPVSSQCSTLPSPEKLSTVTDTAPSSADIDTHPARYPRSNTLPITKVETGVENPTPSEPLAPQPIKLQTLPKPENTPSIDQSSLPSSHPPPIIIGSSKNQPIFIDDIMDMDEDTSPLVQSAGSATPDAADKGPEVVDVSVVAEKGKRKGKKKGEKSGSKLLGVYVPAGLVNPFGGGKVSESEEMGLVGDLVAIRGDKGGVIRPKGVMSNGASGGDGSRPSRNASPAAVKQSAKPARQSSRRLGSSPSRQTSSDRERETDEMKTAENDDHCSACLGRGVLLCCDSCPRSFHFNCVEEGFSLNDLPEGVWECKACRTKNARPSRPTHRTGKKSRSAEVSPTKGHLWDDLLTDLDSMNPRVFQLTRDIREYFEGVYTHPLTGAFIDTYTTDVTMVQKQPKPPSKSGKRKSDARGKDDNASSTSNPADLPPQTTHLCFKCNKSGLTLSQTTFLNSFSVSQPKSVGGRLRLQTQRSELIQCDYCPLWWHLDCLSPPLAGVPVEKEEGLREVVDLEGVRWVKERTWGGGGGWDFGGELGGENSGEGEEGGGGEGGGEGDREKGLVQIKKKWMCPCHSDWVGGGRERRRSVSFVGEEVVDDEEGDDGDGFPVDLDVRAVPVEVVWGDPVVGGSEVGGPSAKFVEQEERSVGKASSVRSSARLKVGSRRESPGFGSGSGVVTPPEVVSAATTITLNSVNPTPQTSPPRPLMGAREGGGAVVRVEDVGEGDAFPTLLDPSALMRGLGRLVEKRKHRSGEEVVNEGGDYGEGDLGRGCVVYPRPQGETSVYGEKTTTTQTGPKLTGKKLYERTIKLDFIDRIRSLGQVEEEEGREEEQRQGVRDASARRRVAKMLPDGEIVFEEGVLRKMFPGLDEGWRSRVEELWPEGGREGMGRLCYAAGEVLGGGSGTGVGGREGEADLGMEEEEEREADLWLRSVAMFQAELAHMYNLKRASRAARRVLFASAPASGALGGQREGGVEVGQGGAGDGGAGGVSQASGREEVLVESDGVRQEEEIVRKTDPEWVAFQEWKRERERAGEGGSGGGGGTAKGEPVRIVKSKGFGGRLVG
ncbi:hypothetical protein HDV00_003416 [Rhizophlyctis rosea]|nr:hypothetical protein HDV00_003416 [Rhizophlyctis rosea]